MQSEFTSARTLARMARGEHTHKIERRDRVMARTTAATLVGTVAPSSA
jgi:hypothetical protein